ncbi:MAG: WG repeat-containing protein [Candidatus Obscuribacter sp.]|nr:WG repeat-containing protein [Candidatus Obscuribacter sp.]MBK9277023.1 WG repeat-containing protein [Candidatus Obscuribacter sp.]
MKRPPQGKRLSGRKFFLASVLCGMVLFLPFFFPEQAALAQWFGSDDEIYSNWMVDRKTQRLLSSEQIKARLEREMKALEGKLQALAAAVVEAKGKSAPGSTAADAEADFAAYSSRLIEIYDRLGFTARAEELIARLECSYFKDSQWFLQNYYQSRDHRKLVEILWRSYHLREQELPQEQRCCDLTRIADLHYTLGQMDKAESTYKLASDMALQLALEAPAQGDGKKCVSIGSIYSYACFLAVRGRLEPATALYERCLGFWEREKEFNFGSGYAGFDYLGTFLELIKDKDVQLHKRLQSRWQSVFRDRKFAGILDKKGVEVTAPEFAPFQDLVRVSTFSQGLGAAAHKYSRLFGYVDTRGNWKIAPRFIRANAFSSGVATVKLSNGLFPIDVEGQWTPYSLIDKNGKELVQLPDMDVGDFEDGLAQGYRRGYIRCGLSDLIDENGDILFSGTFHGPLKRVGNRFSLLIITGQSKSGCIVSPTGYFIDLMMEPDPHRPGHKRLVQILPENGGPTSPPGEIVFSSSLESIGASSAQSKVGSLNSSGRAMSEGLAAFKAGERWGFVDAAGRVVVPAKYDEVGDFKDGVAFYQRKLKSAHSPAAR